jgi:hypothetical protein
MKTTNKRQYESLKHLLALCEQHHEQLEATPLGKAFLDQLRQAVGNGAGYFKGEAGGRNAAHEATVLRGEKAVTVRLQANKLRRAARVLGTKSGVPMELPPLRDASDQQLIADTRALLDATTPLADVFRAHKIRAYDDLHQEIAALDSTMDAQAKGRRERKGAGTAVHAALRSGAEAAAGLEPLFFALVSDDPQTATEWKSAARVGPSRTKAGAARTKKDDVPATPSVPAPEKPVADKVA